MLDDRSGRAWLPVGAPRPTLLFRIANAPFIVLIRLYQATLSPLLGRHCRFVPTCSVYGLACFRSLPTHRALWLTAWRVLRCNPFGGKGVDPPPIGGSRSDDGVDSRAKPEE